MKKIRLGNDIHVSWEILRNGEPEDFTDKVVEVKLVHAQTFTAVPIEWSIEGNVIEFDFFGKDQKRKGEYRIILTENRGELGMSTLDACEAFYLVDHSCKESDGTKCPTLKVQHVRLTGSFSLSGGGGSVVNPDISGQIEEHNQDKEAHPFIQNKIAKVVSEALADYVKKETGKGLSTNDFTDELKSKLDGYDPSELRSEIGKLETALNTLVSGNASNAIESFNEIVAFLNSVSDTETLEGIIAGIMNTVSKIEEKIPTKVSELENDVPYASNLVITQDSDPATIFNILSSGNYSKIKAEYVNGDYTYSGEAIEVVPNESNYSINFIGNYISSQNEKYNRFGIVFNIVVNADEIIFNYESDSSTIYPYKWNGITANDIIWENLDKARRVNRLVIIGDSQPEVASISYLGSSYPSFLYLSTASNSYYIKNYWSAETPYYEVIKIDKHLKEISVFTSLKTSMYNKIEVTRDKTFDNYTHIEDYTNEYQGELIFGDTVYTVTFPEEVKWSTDSILEYKPNHTYQFKIVNGLGVMKEFANS